MITSDKAKVCQNLRLGIFELSLGIIKRVAKTKHVQYAWITFNKV